MNWRSSGLTAIALLASSLWGCPAVPPPGDLPMGQYAVRATGGVVGFLFDAGDQPADAGPDGGVPPAPQCELVEVTGADFEFNATLTRESTSERAWITLNTYSREGTFDGQVLRTQAEASRVFVACGKCSTRVVETLDVAVLSRSQNEALMGACPENALDGGVPAPNPDAGILPPGKTAQGYDAVRLCGELTTVVVALGQVDGGACERGCGGCTVRYQLRGERR